MSELLEKAVLAKQASFKLATLPSDLKNRALEWGDNAGIWGRDETADPPKEEEKPEVPEDPEDSIPTPDEDISFTEMFAYGFGFIRDIREEELREEEEQAQSFADFVTIGG